MRQETLQKQHVFSSYRRQLPIGSMCSIKEPAFSTRHWCKSMLNYSRSCNSTNRLFNSLRISRYNLLSY